jgi:hypothetical protein
VGVAVTTTGVGGEETHPAVIDNKSKVTETEYARFIGADLLHVGAEQVV